MAVSDVRHGVLIDQLAVAKLVNHKLQEAITTMQAAFDAEKAELRAQVVGAKASRDRLDAYCRGLERQLEEKAKDARSKRSWWKI